MRNNADTSRREISRREISRTALKRLGLIAALLLAHQAARPAAAQPPEGNSLAVQDSESPDEAADKVARWLAPQQWTRDTDRPVISLGAAGDFDDTHIFAPCVATLNGEYWLWYCGSTGAVEQRVFQIGLAASGDGQSFKKQNANPVFSFGDGAHSILTPTLLRNADGKAIREGGKLRMWFSATDFTDATGRHTLRQTTSEDGVTWDQPSDVQLEGVYAPSILEDGDVYHLWYTDVSGDPWIIRHATSRDGERWNVDEEPALSPEQEWEQSRLFYPTVIKVDGVFLMWYGSYWSARSNTTAIGLAVSVDGKTWYRHPENPVLRPDPARPWESHYTTSQSVIRDDDGSFRIWYASRKAPPFVNKYFAINTAVWAGPASAASRNGNSRSQ